MQMLQRMMVISHKIQKNTLSAQHTFQQVATEQGEAHRYMDVKNNNNAKWEKIITVTKIKGCLGVEMDSNTTGVKPFAFPVGWSCGVFLVLYPPPLFPSLVCRP